MDARNELRGLITELRFAARHRGSNAVPALANALEGWLDQSPNTLLDAGAFGIRYLDARETLDARDPYCELHGEEAK